MPRTGHLPLVTPDGTLQVENGVECVTLDTTGDIFCGEDLGTVGDVISGADVIATDDLRATGKVYERGRSVAIGEWTNYTITLAASAGVVTPGTNYARYLRIGTTVFVRFGADAFSLSLAAAVMSFNLPSGLDAEPVFATTNFMCQLYTSDVGQQVCLGEVFANANTVQFQRLYAPAVNFPASPFVIYIRGQFCYETDAA